LAVARDRDWCVVSRTAVPLEVNAMIEEAAAGEFTLAEDFLSLSVFLTDITPKMYFIFIFIENKRA
jgi:hypothetical protein